MASKYPVKLRVKGGKLCGCRFGYEAGFKITCDVHKAQQAAIAEARQRVNAVPVILWPKKIVRKKLKPYSPEPDLTDLMVRDAIAKRTRAVRRARFEIERELGLTKAKTLKNFTPCTHHRGKKGKRVITASAWRKLQAHMVEYAFTAEQVRTEVLASLTKP